MNVKAIKTDIMNPPKDSFLEKLDSVDLDLQDRDCVVISSKVVAIDEGECIPVSEVPDKDAFVRTYSDRYLEASDEGVWNLSLKNHALLFAAGVDESNGNDHYVLLPKDSMASAKRLREYLIKRFGIKNLGVVIADSHSIPFRLGTLGVSLGWWGFNPVMFFKETVDIFGRPFEHTRINVVDALAGIGVFAMGETDEQTPISIIRNIPHIEFTEKVQTVEDALIPEREDIYYDLMKPFFKK